MAKKRDIVLRHKIADYLNIGTPEETNYVLLGTGFTTLDEEPGAQSESTKYINEASASSSIISYETIFPFESEHVLSQEGIDDIYGIARDHKVGADAEREYVRAELWNPVDGQTTKFKARKFTVAVEVSTYSGENKQVLSGNLNAVGDPVLGTFDTATKTFTADGETPAAQAEQTEE